MNNSRVILVDPGSDFGRVKHRWPFIKEKLPREIKNKSPIFFISEKIDFKKILSQPEVKQAKQIIVVGDDRTFHKIINNFTAIELGKNKIFSLCNSNSSAFSVISSLQPKTRTLNDSDFLHWCIQSMGNKKSRAIDLGIVRLSEKKNKIIEKFFINSASGGISEIFIQEINKEKQAYHSNLIFLKAAMQSFFRYKAPQISVQTGNDVLAYKQKIFSFIIANGIYGMGGIKIAPKAKLTDGLIHCMIIPNLPWSDMLVEIPKLWQNQSIPNEILRRDAKSFRVECHSTGANYQIELDGVLYSNYPAEFSILPRTLHITV